MYDRAYYISIHALCEEGDTLQSVQKSVYCNFYPRPLRGGRLRNQNVTQPTLVISIHALCEEGDP